MNPSGEKWKILSDLELGQNFLNITHKNVANYIRKKSDLMKIFKFALQKTVTK